MTTPVRLVPLQPGEAMLRTAMTTEAVQLVPLQLRATTLPTATMTPAQLVPQPPPITLPLDAMTTSVQLKPVSVVPPVTTRLTARISR